MRPILAAVLLLCATPTFAMGWFVGGWVAASALVLAGIPVAWGFAGWIQERLR